MLQPGDPFERYTIEAEIGRGGMGDVYRAHDPKLGRRVAIKLIAGDATNAEARARLVREARAAAALDHPNAVSIFDVGEHEGTPYIVMELVEARTLRAAIGDAAVPLARRIEQVTCVARALAAAHRRGLVHRDVKPDNVMVRDDGAVKVLDFGIARLSRDEVDPTGRTQSPALATLTRDGAKLGTPAYMAPEQIRGDALDGRVDQFAWGVLAYEVLVGRLPWRGGDDALAITASILTDAVDRAPLELAGATDAVQEVLLRALARKPEDRFASMDDLLAALGAADRDATERAARMGGVTEAQKFSTREVEEVLARAVDQQAKKDVDKRKLGFADLVSVAAQVGVDGDSLRKASRALRASAAPEPPPRAVAPDELRAWVRRRRKAFYRHAGVYVIVNAAIVLLGLGILTFTPFWIWLLPAIGWGVGVAIHGLVAMTADEDDAAHRLAQRRRRGRGLRLRDAAVTAIADAADRRLGAAVDPPRMRIARGPASEPVDRDALAEEEARAEEPARAGAARRAP